MDERRLNTGDLMAMNILSVPPPKTDIPEDRERARVDVYDGADEPATEESVAALLEAGKVVDCSEYYGIPLAWRADDGRFRAILLQYRAVSEDHTFDSAQEAAEWFIETALAVVG